MLPCLYYDVLTLHLFDFLPMPWRGKRKSFSLKGRSFKRRKVSSKRPSFRRSSKKTTWSRKRNSRKPLFRRKMTSRRFKRRPRMLSSLPTPAATLWVDQYTSKIQQNVTGTSPVSGLAFMAGTVNSAPRTTTNGLTPIFTSSPMDLGLLLGMSIGGLQRDSPVGTTRFLLNGYEHSTKIANLANTPLTITRTTIYIKQHIPSIIYADAYQAVTGNGDFAYESWCALIAQSGLSNVGSGGAMASALYPLTSINPWTTTTTKYASTTMPGFRMTDVSEYNRYIKHKGSKTRTLLPGRWVKFTTRSKSSREIDTSELLDAFAYTSAPIVPTSSFVGALKVLAMKGTYHHIYKFEGTPGTSTGGGNTNTTISQIQASQVQTYRYKATPQYQSGAQMYSNVQMPTAITQSIMVPNSATITSFASAT